MSSEGILKELPNHTYRSSGQEARRIVDHFDGSRDRLEVACQCLVQAVRRLPIIGGGACLDKKQGINKPVETHIVMPADL